MTDIWEPESWGSANLPTELLVASVRRMAAAEGVLILVVRKGDPTSGGLLLKIDLGDGTGYLLSQTRLGDDVVWTRRSGDTPLSEAELESICQQESAYDPDLWLVDICDKKGRPWFPGRLV